MFLSPGSRAKIRTLIPIAGTGISVVRASSGYRIATTASTTPTLSFLTASTSANVALNNTAAYFDGPSVAQGSSGIWLASGSITCNSLSAVSDQLSVKLWDGTTVADSLSFHLTAAGGTMSAAVSGVFSSPSGNIRISVSDITSSQGVMLFNNTGNSKDSTVTVVRIG